MANRVIGLDIGSSSVKAAQVLRSDDGTFVVERQASRPIPRGAIYDGHIDEKERLRVAAILAKMFDEEKFSTKDVIFGLNSSASVFMEQIDVPVMKDEDLKKALPAFIEANLEGSAKDNEISYSVVGEVETENGKRLRVLVFRVFAEFAKEIAEVIEKAGLNVVGADVNALAALRAIATQPRPDRQADAIVDIGANVMSLLLHHNGVPKVLTLDPDNAGEVATHRVLDVLGLDEGQEDRAEFHKINDDHNVGLVTQARNDYSKGLAARVAATFRANIDRAEDIDSIAAVTLVGGGALLAGIGYYLREALGEVPMTYAQFDPRITGKDGAPVQRQEPSSGGDYLVAVGLGTGDVF